MRATRKAKLSSQVGDSADRTCNVWIQRNASENSVRAVEMRSMHSVVLESYKSYLHIWQQKTVTPILICILMLESY